MSTKEERGKRKEVDGNFRSPSGDYGRLDRAYGNHDAGQTCPFLLMELVQ